MMMQTLNPYGGRAWRYDGAEIVLDGVVHGLGLILAVAGTIILLGAGSGEAIPLVARVIYCATLLLTLSISAAYNLWPVTPLKWQLRRFDHAMIFSLIAGTYTPFLSGIATTETTILLVAIWGLSLLGIAVKLADIGRSEWLSTLLYILLGWSGLVSIKALANGLPPLSLGLALSGGLLYSLGVIFHHWRDLRFQNAIWHTFVLAAAACHYLAVLLMSEG